ncbi:MAG: hypothetical protein IH991_17410 [Planctomycetes bacterium]|nr:hypothetical protein [Planctomycetota bacterium]
MAELLAILCIFPLATGLRWSSRIALIIALVFCLRSPVVMADGDLGVLKRVQRRSPVALVYAGDSLFVANRRSGTVSVIDGGRRVIDEFMIGQQLSDLKSLDQGKLLLATDEQQHELILLSRTRRRITPIQRLPVASYPVSLVVSKDHSWCSVASLWSRRLTLVSLAPASGPRPRMRVAKTLDLPFAPRVQWMSDDGRWLIAADAFGGNLAIVGVRQSAETKNTSTYASLKKRKIIAVRSIEGHNIRGLSTTPDGNELLIAHQILNPQVPTERARVFWGAVVGNVVRAVSLAELTQTSPQQETSKPIGHWSLFPLGEPKNAAGDPGEIYITPKGIFLIALSGVNAVAIGNDLRKPLTRCQVGQRPIAICVTPDEKFGYVANSLDDTLSVIDLAKKEVIDRISLGPQPNLSLADRGESLFYDARLSLDGWYSCHSCHTDGHTNGRLNDNFADESQGAPKRILSLLGVGQTGPWAWNGSRETLGGQIHKSILTTMRGDEQNAKEQTVNALTSYLKQFKPPPSLRAARGKDDHAAVQSGKLIFRRLGCVECHSPPTYTTPDVFDVQLSDELGNRDFNPPSLRGVSQQDALFHDNRAKNLREVFTRFNHARIKVGKDELDDLVEFLNSL